MYVPASWESATDLHVCPEYVLLVSLEAAATDGARCLEENPRHFLTQLSKHREKYEALVREISSWKIRFVNWK